MIVTIPARWHRGPARLQDGKMKSCVVKIKRFSRTFILNADEPGKRTFPKVFPPLFLRLGSDDNGILVKNRKKGKRNFARIRKIFSTGEK
jgi:hypothetical protein